MGTIRVIYLWRFSPQEITSVLREKKMIMLQGKKSNTKRMNEMLVKTWSNNNQQYKISPPIHT
jgi:hypothetical protein